MNRLLIGSGIGAVIAIAMVALALTAGPSPEPALATHVPLTEVALDMDTTGNTPSGSPSTHTEVLGTREDCNTIASATGGTLDIDATVKGVPPFNSGAFTDGVTGIGANLRYDPAIV